MSYTINPMPYPEKVRINFRHSTQNKFIVLNMGDGYTQIASRGGRGNETRLSVSWCEVSRDELSLLTPYLTLYEDPFVIEYDTGLDPLSVGTMANKYWYVTEQSIEEVSKDTYEVTATLNSILPGGMIVGTIS